MATPAWLAAAIGSRGTGPTLNAPTEPRARSNVIGSFSGAFPVRGVGVVNRRNPYRPAQTHDFPSVPSRHPLIPPKLRPRYNLPTSGPRELAARTTRNRGYVSQRTEERLEGRASRADLRRIVTENLARQVSGAYAPTPVGPAPKKPSTTPLLDFLTGKSKP